MPLIFAGVMLASLEKLHLNGAVAVLLILAVIIGGAVNIPVRRI